MSRIVLCVENGNPYMEETEEYLRGHGCSVYAASETGEEVRERLEEIGQKEGRLDILLLGADGRTAPDGAIGEGHDDVRLLEELSGQLSGAQEAIEGALPLLRRGEQCIGLITTKESSIRCCEADRDYGRHMAWAGLNMLGKIYFNRLRPEGFRFRWFCAEEGAGGMPAGAYLLSGLCYDEKEPYLHSDENRLVMRDSRFREIAW